MRMHGGGGDDDDEWRARMIHERVTLTRRSKSGRRASQQGCRAAGRGRSLQLPASSLQHAPDLRVNASDRCANQKHSCG